MQVSEFLNIDENSRVPKYQQIIDSIVHNISVGNLNIDEKIPSINGLSEEFYLSRDTVEKAYHILKERSIITSIRGKGFYIARTRLLSKTNILFLINKLSPYKMEIYNHFVNGMGPNSYSDLHIYHCDETLFLNLLKKHRMAYDYYVIMCHFKSDEQRHVSFTDEVIKTLRLIPSEKLIILDNFLPSLDKATVQIYQDFEYDIYRALKEGLSKISKYQKLILVYPEKTVYPYPKRIKYGFKRFCIEQNLDFEIINQVYDDMELKKEDLYIVIEEFDLVNLVSQVRESQFELGKDIGIISYNETPLKGLLGITVISTNFRKMGEVAAKTLLKKAKGKTKKVKKQIKVEFNFIDRHSA